MSIGPDTDDRLDRYVVHLKDGVLRTDCVFRRESIVTDPDGRSYIRRTDVDVDGKERVSTALSLGSIFGVMLCQKSAKELQAKLETVQEVHEL